MTPLQAAAYARPWANHTAMPDLEMETRRIGRVVEFVGLSMNK